MSESLYFIHNLNQQLVNASTPLYTIERKKWLSHSVFSVSILNIVKVTWDIIVMVIRTEIFDSWTCFRNLTVIDIAFHIYEETLQNNEFRGGNDMLLQWQFSYSIPDWFFNIVSKKDGNLVWNDSWVKNCALDCTQSEPEQIILIFRFRSGNVPYWWWSIGQQSADWWGKCVECDGGHVRK